MRHFAQKNQFKVFVEASDRGLAIAFFEKFYNMPQLPFYDESGKRLFARKMRAYLVKDEQTFERLAL